ncbi:hypothetical protein ACVWYU_005890, partial [Pseudomonas sp. TE12234]
LFPPVARTKNKRPEQVGAFVGLAFSVFSHSLLVGLFAFPWAKKRGGLTRPHFFLIPFVPFHRPDESLPAMSLPFVLEGRVCPSTQPEY